VRKLKKAMMLNMIEGKSMTSCLELQARYYKGYDSADRPAGLATEPLCLQRDQTALLLIDVYHGVQGDEDIEGLSGPIGKQWRRTVRRISVALEAARFCCLPVVYAINSAPRIGLERSEFGAHFRRSWGADFEQAFREGGVDSREYHGGRPEPLVFPTELEPLPDEYYIRKHVYSAFFDTRLDTLLRNLGVRTLVAAGFWADICMLATALDAFYRNYRVIWLRDGTLGDEEWAVRWFENAIGYTVTVDEFATACHALE
jgi:nicotinamidase-related amidase